MRLRLAAVLAACISCGEDETCHAVEVPADGESIGRLVFRGESWRVQLRELPARCEGVTSYSSRLVSISPNARSPEAVAMHETGHLIGIVEHDDESHAVMSERVEAVELAPADARACLAAGACASDAVPAAARLAPATDARVSFAHAVLRWSTITIERVTFAPEGR